ncbi:bifunctional tRNA (5-methylaminomethyl-2-thiouridine)(34)-methyltransferase MnmD/FAD-dependent 5-carboxymethylaminomethyl-2-thiouridine(34) oxidoreductase MnmC [Suttonella sp. R2A3]|uniref:bifunctional tRNA (5-methylaminomethyl-2-thiouridine)(34)-methyltransferase MnmD/FAD-dependent 5-carboxymethylaminomethyl-2-thiouridine(34) oxidoreductase MnmC n=1 Tax=Suttonella sp. R2A3 TaxID=2908648 RepID=UPI001F1BAB45|nr:bifunctional tRNA (5-methylaminomethyl-2-thiouridine)(34)-methyltransferase MnmD/FAD-dependent 5-carboxymethylaminomethyl-2-thiouridine(34) oxidoreductase MnmC [Suttonella sp. R2A3]UJF24801.1 bifunctional tRNA (5-methylaminomethyl-2-thiouridine)(34)-methyltransferase MnmD/FAD-dependent 5-carboxymethylaminomethyl-2-thiouridine(34) oxidoreductase MnmC [Suttonella sp. R2A3]
MALLEYANIHWRNGSPYSERFDDIFYQPDDGWAESTHTFIHANNLCERFAAWQKQNPFVIGEIGFGSGLNLFNTAAHFLSHAPTSARLHYVSFEKHPWCLEDLKAVQQEWDLAECRAALYAQYPHNHPGWHQIRLHPRITLTLILGDVKETLPELHAQIDAWFLDGFAPSRNPDCWSQNLCNELSRCSHTQTTFATFSAARVVREALQAAGFTIEKARGFARKRDMLRGSCNAPKCAPPHWTDMPADYADKQVAVIGAGIAGATTAQALARAGIPVTVFADNTLHPSASDVPLAVPYLQPGREDTPQRRYQLTAWHTAMRYYQQFAHQDKSVYQPLPIVRTATNDHERRKHQNLIAQQLLNRDEWHSDACDNLVFSRGGTIDLPQLCEALLDHPLITQKNHAVNALNRDVDAWVIDNMRFTHVVLCTGWQKTLFPEPAVAEGIRAIRGQGTLYQSANSPSFIHCSHKTIIPDAKNGRVYCGASFGVYDIDHQPRDADDAANRAFLESTWSDVASEQIGNFVGVRGGTRDYLPLVGPIATSASAEYHYDGWRWDAGKKIERSLTYHPNLLIHAGLGSKGCTYAFLNAELISALLTNAPLPVPRSLLAYLFPSRFILRAIIRNQEH